QCNYHSKPKNSTIYTPPAVSQFIFELLKDKRDRDYLWNGVYPVVGIDLDPNSSAD
ncbi:18610_t:CDS:2, partial [Funneliformis geosporum]